MRRLVENVDYFVRIVPFPCRGADGIVVVNDDGTFSIYLDANVDEAHQREALAHELEHIMQDHFYSDIEVEIIEMEADDRPPKKLAL